MLVMIASIIHSPTKKIKKTPFPPTIGHGCENLRPLTLDVAFCATLGGIVLPGGCCCLAGFCPMKSEENTVSNDQSHDSHVSVCVSCGL